MTYIDRWATQLSLVSLLNVFTIIGTYSYNKYLRTVCINIVASKPAISYIYFMYNFEEIKSRLNSRTECCLSFHIPLSSNLLFKYRILKYRKNCLLCKFIEFRLLLWWRKIEWGSFKRECSVNLCVSNFTWLIISREMWWEGNVEYFCQRGRKVQKFVFVPEVNRSLEGSRIRWEQ